MVTIRQTEPADLTYIKRLNFLTEVFGDERKPVPADFEEGIPFYVEHWRPEDGVIAFDDHGIPAGALWYLWGNADNHGTGYVRDDYPELAIAVENRNQGQGVAGKLFKGVFEQLRERNIPGVSLCVHQDNTSAQEIYEAKGFTFVHENGDWNVFALELT